MTNSITTISYKPMVIKLIEDYLENQSISRKRIFLLKDNLLEYIKYTAVTKLKIDINQGKWTNILKERDTQLYNVLSIVSFFHECVSTWDTEILVDDVPSTYNQILKEYLERIKYVKSTKESSIAN